MNDVVRVTRHERPVGHWLGSTLMCEESLEVIFIRAKYSGGPGRRCPPDELSEPADERRVLLLASREVEPFLRMEVGGNVDALRSPSSEGAFDRDSYLVSIEDVERLREGPLGSTSIKVVEEDCVVPFVAVEPVARRAYKMASIEAFSIIEVARFPASGRSKEQSNLRCFISLSHRRKVKVTESSMIFNPFEGMHFASALDSSIEESRDRFAEVPSVALGVEGPLSVFVWSRDSRFLFRAVGDCLFGRSTALFPVRGRQKAFERCKPLLRGEFDIALVMYCTRFSLLTLEDNESEMGPCLGGFEEFFIGVGGVVEGKEPSSSLGHKSKY